MMKGSKIRCMHNLNDSVADEKRSFAHDAICTERAGVVSAPALCFDLLL